LRELLEAVSEPPSVPLHFMVGDRRMYAREERDRFIALPARLWTDLSEDSARALEKRLTRDGVAVKRRSSRTERRRGRIGGGLAAVGVPASALAIVAAQPLLVAAAIAACFVGLGLMISSRAAGRMPVLALRKAPAALPAADQLVARLLAAMDGAQPDVVEQLTELALLVQRLTERRAELLGGARAELEAVTAPVEPLVAVLEREAAGLVALDRELASLDEGVMVRALAASEARGEPAAQREPVLAGLDRLRALEDARVATMRRLLDASALLRRAIEVGMRVVDEEAVQRAELERARALLDEG
jgi:hypothetical protein